MGKMDKQSKWLTLSTGIFQVLIGAGAVLGGFHLVTDPTGGSLGMSVNWLAGTPFTSFLIPGIILLIFNGFGTLAGSGATFSGYRFAGEIAILLGGGMMIWILTQVALIGLMNFLQPLYFSVGIIEVILGIMLRKTVRNAVQFTSGAIVENY